MFYNHAIQKFVNKLFIHQDADSRDIKHVLFITESLKTKFYKGSLVFPDVKNLSSVTLTYLNNTINI